jgi:Nodulation protein Z (NodZ)
VVKGRAGLGNRMLCAVTGILYARLTERNLIIDWSDRIYSADRSNVFPRLFACRSLGGQDIPNTDSVAPASWRGRLHLSVVELEKAGTARGSAFIAESSVDLTTLAHDADVAVMWAYSERLGLLRRHFQGRFEELRGLSNREILGTLIRQELVPHPHVQTRIDQFTARHLAGRTVGVHVRWSDRRVRARAILTELDRLLDREPELTIFAATDNVEAKTALERRYPRVITAPHWYPSPGARMHDNRDCPDPLESAIEALIDLHLLASCDHLIGDSSSSFTRVAALLRSRATGEFIDVKPTKLIDRVLADETWRRYAALSRSPFAGVVRTLLRAARRARPTPALPARAAGRRRSLSRADR